MTMHRTFGLPPVTFNFLIINILMYFIKIVFEEKYNIDITEYLGLRYFMSNDFHWYQFITYMFLHANLTHLFFNMFGLFMFGPLLEQIWGSKKFLMYYMLCGLGAALTQYVFYYFSIQDHIHNLYDFYNNDIMKLTDEAYKQKWIIEWSEMVQETYSMMVVIGASGAIYGLLAAYAVLFPNSYFYIYFVMPVKAKWFVIFFGLVELFMGVFLEDNVAHFAHLGGMAVGIIWVLIWKHKNKPKFFTEM